MRILKKRRRITALGKKKKVRIFKKKEIIYINYRLNLISQMWHTQPCLFTCQCKAYIVWYLRTVRDYSSIKLYL